MFKTLITRSVALAAAAAAAVLLSIAAPADAQTPTGTITGRVTDQAGLSVPGATVTVTSTNLQGTRVAVTSANGDFIVPSLPPGPYTVTVELSGFGTTKSHAGRRRRPAVTLELTLRPAALSEVVTVTANTDTFVNTVPASTNIKQELLATLPTARTLLSAVNLAPARPRDRPVNAITIGGAMSFENLFLLNGVQIQDNIRGTPFTLFIEDAIQETTVSTSGISAEYGRFTGGVVNAITKSGGNRFSGSFRTTFNNDDWRTTSPFDEPKTNATVPTYEFTIGGPIVRNRTWFFVAGRIFDQSHRQRDRLHASAPIRSTTTRNGSKAKSRKSLGTSHNLRGAYTAIRETEANNAWPSPQEVMDLAACTRGSCRRTCCRCTTRARCARTCSSRRSTRARGFPFENSGGTSTDLIEGTVLRSQQTGAFWWSPNFCGVCGPEERDNDNLFLKGTYFLSTPRGSHNIVFGYDTFNDKRKGDNHQSGSDFQVWTTDTLVENGAVYPVAADNGSTYIIYYPIRQASQGTNFRTHSLFLNDSWSANKHFTFNLGLALGQERRHGCRRQRSSPTTAPSARASAWCGIPPGNGRWSLHGSYGRYVAALANSIADSASPAGTPSILAWFYHGPDINTGTGRARRVRCSAAADLRLVRQRWRARAGLRSSRAFPECRRRSASRCVSPHAHEFATGASRQLGARGAIRADFVYRTFTDFYADRIDTAPAGHGRGGTGVRPRAGREHRPVVAKVHRRQRPGQLPAADRGVDLGGNYTLSRLWGNVNGETVNSGPVISSPTSYPEYFDLSWFAPEGDLAPRSASPAAALGHRPPAAAPSGSATSPWRCSNRSIPARPTAHSATSTAGTTSPTPATRPRLPRSTTGSPIGMRSRPRRCSGPTSR